jgi:hypothetical protein
MRLLKVKHKTALEYRKKLNDLVRTCRKAGVKVRFVPGGSLKDYAGVNDEAAKKLGFHKLPDDTILIDRDMSIKTQYKNLIHEVEEMVRMEKLGDKYWMAHLAALRAENQGLSEFVKEEMAKGV